MRRNCKPQSKVFRSFTFQITRNYFTEDQKHSIIQDYLSSGATKRSIWKKYTGHDQEHGQLLDWMRKLGYLDHPEKKCSTFSRKPLQVKQKKTDIGSTDSFETLQLKKRLVELEKQLKDAEMKAVAFSAMIDIAEKEFQIPIRKKYNTKPSKK